MPDTDRPLVSQGCLQRRLGEIEIRNGLRPPRPRLSDVGLGNLADGKTILGGAQFTCQH